jgi:hypothetical protein
MWLTHAVHKVIVSSSMPRMPCVAASNYSSIRWCAFNISRVGWLCSSSSCRGPPVLCLAQCSVDSHNDRVIMRKAVKLVVENSLVAAAAAAAAAVAATGAASQVSPGV